MADTGQAWILIDGAGRSHGRWFISGISETRSELLRSGAARKIDFTINLTRYWGSDPARFGDILESLP
jgi:phage protein U